MAREKFPSDDVDRLMVRFPAGMRDRLKAEAEANKRSMNAEIVGRLEASLANMERARKSIYGGGKPLELDEEFYELMMSAFEGARARHEAKYGVLPLEMRKPAQFPLQVDEPSPGDINISEIPTIINRLKTEIARLEKISLAAKADD